MWMWNVGVVCIISLWASLGVCLSGVISTSGCYRVGERWSGSGNQGVTAKTWLQSYPQHSDASVLYPSLFRRRLSSKYKMYPMETLNISEHETAGKPPVFCTMALSKEGLKQKKALSRKCEVISNYFKCATLISYFNRIQENVYKMQLRYPFTEVTYTDIKTW